MQLGQQHDGLLRVVLLLLVRQLRLVLAAQRVVLRLPDALDFRLVDQLLLGDIVSMCRLWSTLRFG